LEYLLHHALERLESIRGYEDRHMPADHFGGTITEGLFGGPTKGEDDAQG
jgi:hypothetical protein